MTIRGEILAAVSKATEGLVKHCDIWNSNIEYLEQEPAWAMPAVFVEFDTIDLRPTKSRTFQVRAGLQLHLVTDADTDAETRFALVDHIIAQVSGTLTPHATIVGPRTISTNHNHGDIVEEIILFDYSAIATYDT